MTDNKAENDIVFSDYSSESDSGLALWEKVSRGDVQAEEALVAEYSRLVRMCARPYFLAGGDSEDLIQEGMIGLLSAIRRYEPASGVPFRAYAEFCIRRRLYSAIKSAARYKHTPLNDYVSIESPQFDESNAASSSFLRDPEDLVIAREHFHELSRGFLGKLSGFESQIMGLYLDGLSYEEMAAKVGRSAKSVDNAVQRIRKKLTQFLNNGDSQ